MEYKIIIEKASRLFAVGFERSAEKLAAEVNAHIERGWEPQGGISYGQTQATRRPYLFQAMVKRR